MKPLILMVDDDPVILTVMKLVLEQAGYICCLVENAKRALEVFSATDAFSLVLMDWRMHEFDGLMCAKAMREIDENRNRRTPIVMVTASAMSGDRETCLDAGMDDFLAKPFLSQQLKEVVAKHIVLDTGGLLYKASQALAGNNKPEADLCFIQIMVFLEHIFGSDKNTAFLSALAIADVLKNQGMIQEATMLEKNARSIFVRE